MDSKLASRLPVASSSVPAYRYVLLPNLFDLNWFQPEIAGEFIDHVRGAKEKRVEIDRLMAAAHQRTLNVLIVRKFDRFARSVSHPPLLRVFQTFGTLGIEFVRLSEQMDRSPPTGKMVFTVLSAVAELERV